MKNIQIPYLIALVIFISIHMSSFGQSAPDIGLTKEKKTSEGAFWANSREVGLNFTSLISKFVPFNIGDKSSGLIGIKSKFYGDNFAFRTTFGASTSNESGGFFHFGLGYERRFGLSGKFTYTSGWQTLLEVESAGRGNGSSLLLGAAKFYGLEYNLYDNFFLGAESQLAIGINSGNDNGLELSFRYPVALFANVRIFNK